MELGFEVVGLRMKVRCRFRVSGYPILQVRKDSGAAEHAGNTAAGIDTSSC